jgi:hypothetical protein
VCEKEEARAQRGEKGAKPHNFFPRRERAPREGAACWFGARPPEAACVPLPRARLETVIA